MAVAFTVAHDTLRRLVDRVAKIVERRNTIPILSNLVVRAEEDGRLSVQATDLDIWATATAPAGSATVETAGVTTVPAGLLGDILKKMGKADIRFVSDERTATVSAGRSRFKLNELPAADFPEATAIDAQTRFDLEQEDLRRIVADCGFAISTEETRYYLNGIFLHPGEGTDDQPHRLTAVATDGHRLSLLHTSLATSIEGMKGVIVPRKTVGLFTLVADTCDEGERVSIGVSETQIEFETRDFRVTSRLIDGTFPDYNRVIPRANDSRALVDPKILSAAVDRVATVSSERGRAVKFAFAGETLGLTVTSPDAGEARDEIETGPHDAFELEIGFNARYVIDALATFAESRITIALNDPGSPALLHAPGVDTRLVVLMPMRV